MGLDAIQASEEQRLWGKGFVRSVAGRMTRMLLGFKKQIQENTQTPRL